jgi:polyferredoxin
MLKKLRVALAVLFWAGITLLLLDVTGALHGWLGWMAKIQFLPAVMALNAAVIAGLVLMTLLFGRIYCSVICPLGVFQDAVAHVSVARKRRKKDHRPYSASPERKWLRYGVWVLFVAALIAGVQVFVALLAPYSAYGRMVQNFLQPIMLWGNNLLALISERAGSYAFYHRDVWLRSLPTFLVAAATLVAVVILAWRNGRTWCNTICPVGTTLSFFSRFALFRPVIDADKCKDCHHCEHNCKAACIDIGAKKIDYSRCVDCFNCLEDCTIGAIKYRFAYGRKNGGEKAPAGANGAGRKAAVAAAPQAAEGRRAFLAGAALALGSATLGAQSKKLDGGYAAILDKEIPERDMPITPFGSASVKEFYAKCTACQLCVAACPNGVLRPSTDLRRLMQPEMSYERGFCRPECVRCSEVCPTGAILKITKEEKTQYRVGLAHVHRDLCVVETEGVSCGNCARKCPVGAIKMVKVDPDDPSSLRRPTVIETRCIGCGACENLCPARPLSAITVDGRSLHLTEDSNG